MWATIMLPSTPEIADRKPNVRAAESNRSGRVVGLDGRRCAARRVRDLTASFVAALGGASCVDAALMVNVKAAAELVCAAETARARMLRGETIDLGELVKLQNAADRAVRSLAIPPGAAKPRPPSLAEHLAAKYGPPA
jgi:hypothetical protein